MAGREQHRLHYRQTFNPIHLLRLLSTEHPNHSELHQRLFGFFQLEQARKIRFVKEDVFIREALRGEEKAQVDSTTLVRLLKDRKLYLVEIIRQCDKAGLAHKLMDEMKILEEAIASHNSTAVKQPYKFNVVGKSKTLTNLQHARATPSKKKYVAPYLNLLGRLKASFQLHSHSKISASAHHQAVASHNSRKLIAKETIIATNNHSVSYAKRNSSSHLKRKLEPSEIGSLLQDTTGVSRRKLEMKRSSQSKTVWRHKNYTNSRINTTMTATSNSKFLRRKHLVKEHTQMADLESQNQIANSNNSFSQYLGSEGEDRAELENRVTKPQRFVLTRSNLHARTLFNFEQTQLPDVQCHDDETDSIKSNEFIKDEKLESAEVEVEPELGRINNEVRSSRNHQVKIKKLSKVEQFELQAIYLGESVFAKQYSTLNKQKEPRDKITYMQQAPLVRLRPKALYADRHWKRTGTYHQNDLSTALQILFEKFSTFTEDKTLLSFKQVKGFLRETVSQLKRLSPAKDEELLNFDKLLAQSSDDDDEVQLTTARLTLQDLVSLISELSEINSKQPLRRSYYPLSDITYQYLIDSNNKVEGRNQSNSNPWSRINRYREAFKEQTSELQNILGNEEELHQHTPNCSIHLQILSRWLYRLEHKTSLGPRH